MCPLQCVRVCWNVSTYMYFYVYVIREDEANFVEAQSRAE